MILKKKKETEQDKDDMFKLFAKRLTDKNEYLTQQWERTLHFESILSACRWGESVKNVN